MTKGNEISFQDRNPKDIIKINSATKLLGLVERIRVHREVEIIINDENYAGIKKALKQTEVIGKLIRFTIHFSSFGKTSTGIDILQSITFPQTKIISITFDTRHKKGENDITKLALTLNKQAA